VPVTPWIKHWMEPDPRLWLVSWTWHHCRSCGAKSSVPCAIGRG